MTLLPVQMWLQTVLKTLCQNQHKRCAFQHVVVSDAPVPLTAVAVITAMICQTSKAHL